MEEMPGRGLSRSIPRQLVTALGDLVPVGLCLIDAAGCHIEVNDAYCRLYGYRREELLGQPIELVVPPEDVETAHTVLLQILRGERPSGFLTQLKGRRKDGTRIWLEGQVAHVIGDDGHPWPSPRSPTSPSASSARRRSSRPETLPRPPPWPRTSSSPAYATRSGRR